MNTVAPNVEMPTDKESTTFESSRKSVHPSGDLLSTNHPSPLITHHSSLITPTAHVSLRITREGWGWLLLTGILLATGLYKGINLLSFLGMGMAATWFIHLIWTGLGLRRLGLRRWTDGWVFAQTPFILSHEVINHGRRPQFGLSLEDRGAGHFWSWFIPKLEKGAKIQFHTEMALPRRGLYDWQPTGLRTGFPFGLVERCLSAEAEKEFVVLPRLGRLHRGALRRMLFHGSPSLGQSRTSPRRHPAAQSDFHGLRAFRSGDSPHWIHWRTSARLGELMVREFEETPNDNLTIILDAWLPANLEQNSNAKDRLEHAVTLAATICWEWCREPGNRLVVGIADKSPLVVQGETGQDLCSRTLQSLATVTGHTTPDVIQLAASMRSTLPPGPILVLTTSPGKLQTTMEKEFHRPVTCINVSNLGDLDFFEW
ncbi:MAG TPA: DUF58 domain-containing protein [Gemmataceae bacterium]|jgi:uncharacterized protein (DUF58 family)|nr:DUF58 domain-containing protein [Gemmataceae bacterium]